MVKELKSDKKFIHLLNCPFTGLGLYQGYRGDIWLQKRIKIFKNFVLQSLLNQENNNFILWISWRPEEKTNPIVNDFIKSLNGIRGLKTVHTFHGILFWDDKYPNDLAAKRLKNNLKNTLNELRELVKDADYVYMTIQPSDDMYCSYVVKDIQSTFQANRAVGFSNGYIMNFSTKEVAEYNPDTIPPFFTIMFPKDIFLDYEKHFKYIGPYKSHEYIKAFMKFDLFEKKGFCVGTHGENISTTFNHPYKGRTIKEEELDKVLLSLGIYFQDPVVFKTGRRLLARKILNKLPFQNKIRELYHKLPPKWRYL